MTLVTLLKCVGLAVLAALAMSFIVACTYIVIKIIKELKDGG